MRSTQFFGPGSPGEPSPAEFEAWRTRMERPDNEVGWVLPVSAILGRTPDAAVAVTHITAFTTGVAFNLAVRLRVAPDRVRGHGLSALISPRLPSGVNVDADQRLLLGVEYADGRTAINTDNRVWPPGQQDEHEPLLMASGGGGGDLSVDQGFWLSPVPPGRPLHLRMLLAGLRHRRDPPRHRARQPHPGKLPSVDTVAPAAHQPRPPAAASRAEAPQHRMVRVCSTTTPGQRRLARPRFTSTTPNVVVHPAAFGRTQQDR